MTHLDFDPLLVEPVEEIPLANAPLARVVAQVQFTPIFKIRSEDYVAPFQELIRAEYPKAQHESHRISQFGTDAEVRTDIIWRFQCAKGDWLVSLAPTFVALETRAYTSRADFMIRFKGVVTALKSAVGSARVTRVGVRYVDHLKSPEVESVTEMLRPEMLGVVNTPLHPRLLHMFSEVFCDVAEGNLLARWGLLPPNGTHDPNVIAPIPATSWFLDLDVFKQYAEPFEELDADAIHSTALALATRVYALFRWATTDRFMEVYGGKR